MKSLFGGVSSMLHNIQREMQANAAAVPSGQRESEQLEEEESNNNDKKEDVVEKQEIKSEEIVVTGEQHQRGEPDYPSQNVDGGAGGETASSRQMYEEAKLNTSLIAGLT
jgi:hypothetical protein